MGAPLRKFAAANDARPAPLAPRPIPRVIPYVRLAPAPPPRRNVFWAEALAALFLASTLFLLGAVAGTVFWFTYDTAPPEDITMSAPQPTAPQPQIVMAQPTPQPAPADIVLPAAEEPAPAAPSAPADISGMQLVIRDRGANDAEMLLENAEAQLESGKVEAALVFYERALAAEPANRAALEGKADTLGRLAAKPDTPAAPLTALRKLALAAPDDAAIQANYAKALAQRGEVKEAIVYLSRALQLAPGDRAARFDLAVLYDRAGDAPNALALYGQILQLAGDGDDLFPPATIESIRRRATWLAGRQNRPNP